MFLLLKLLTFIFRAFKPFPFFNNAFFWAGNAIISPFTLTLSKEPHKQVIALVEN